MKLVFLKISALGILLLGIAFVGQFIQCPYICAYIAKFTDGSFDIFPGSTRLAIGIISILIGGYAFLPQLPKKKQTTRTIKQILDKGIVEINLETLEKECCSMLKSITPIKHLTITIHPDKENKKLKIELTPEITITESQKLPDTEDRIISTLEEFLNNYFGLSVSFPISIKIDNIKVENEIYSTLGKTALDTYSERLASNIHPIPQVSTIPQEELPSTTPITTIDRTTEVKQNNLDSSKEEDLLSPIEAPPHWENQPETTITTEDSPTPLGSLDMIEKESEEKEEKSYLSELIKKLEEEPTSHQQREEKEE